MALLLLYIIDKYRGGGRGFNMEGVGDLFYFEYEIVSHVFDNHQDN